MVLALWRKNDELKKAALGFFLVTGLFSVPAYLTGEPAEDVVGPLAGFSKPIIDRHEEAVGVALTGIVMLSVGALAGLVLFRGSKSVPAWFTSVTLATSLFVSGLVAWTADPGGQIRHTEIRSGANATVVSGDKGPN